MLNNAAPELRAAANALAAKPGTSARPTLIAGLRDSANGLEEIAGLYWLRDGLAKTQNALRPIVDNQTVSTDTCRSTASMLNNAAPELRAAANALAAKPGTSARPTLIAGLRDSANGLEEIAGLYWLRDGLTKTYNALVPMAAGTPLTDETRDATTTMLWNSAPELRAAANALAAKPGTSARPALIAGLRDSASGLEELAGVYELKNCAQKGLEFATMCSNYMSPPSAAQVNAGVDEMYITDARLLATIARLSTENGTSARPALINGLNQAHTQLAGYQGDAETLRSIANDTYWFLGTALFFAQSTINDQKNAAQAGLDQIQDQCGGNIGQVGAGLTQLQSQCSANIGQVAAGLTQLQSQCSANIGQVGAGLTQLQSQCSANIGQVAAGLSQLRTQCSDNMGQVNAGLAQIGQQSGQVNAGPGTAPSAVQQQHRSGQYRADTAPIAVQRQYRPGWAGLTQLQTQCADNTAQVQAGLAQLRTQCADNIGQVSAGLAQLGGQTGQVEAGLAQLQTQCHDNLGVTAAGLDQMKRQCSGQKGTAEAGLTQMYNQLNRAVAHRRRRTRAGRVRQHAGRRTGVRR